MCSTHVQQVLSMCLSNVPQMFSKCKNVFELSAIFSRFFAHSKPKLPKNHRSQLIATQRIKTCVQHVANMCSTPSTHFPLPIPHNKIRLKSALPRIFYFFSNWPKNPENSAETHRLCSKCQILSRLPENAPFYGFRCHPIAGHVLARCRLTSKQSRPFWKAFSNKFLFFPNPYAFYQLFLPLFSRFNPL